MRIDPQRLLRLGELIRQGSFKRAASKLAVTQPALSQSIAQMEAEVGVRLLERTPHGVVPTIYGEALARHANVIEAELRHAASRINELTSDQRGKLAIGGLSGGPVSLIALAICRLRDRMPELDTELVEELWSSALLERIEERTIDLALCNHLDNQELEGLKTIPFFQATRVLCVRKGHPAEHDLTLQALTRYPFSSPRDEMGFQIEMDRIFAAAGLPFPKQQILLSNSLAAAKQIVIHSDAFALFSNVSVLAELEAGILTTAPLPSVEDRYWNHLVLREDHVSGRLLSAFIGVLAEVCRDLGLPIHPEGEKLVRRGVVQDRG